MRVYVSISVIRDRMPHSCILGTHHITFTSLIAHKTTKQCICVCVRCKCKVCGSQLSSWPWFPLISFHFNSIRCQLTCINLLVPYYDSGYISVCVCACTSLLHHRTIVCTICIVSNLPESIYHLGIDNVPHLVELITDNSHAMQTP